MTPWVYVFSQFTPEALLFEALIICGLAAGYAAFYVLRKRRLGVAEEELPAGVVRNYLNALIGDAEAIRAQLFGILQSAGVDMSAMTGLAMRMPIAAAEAAPAASVPTAGAADPATAQKIAFLEAKMAEQARAMQALVADKERIQKELAAAKTQKVAVTGDAATKELQTKINTLEGKLAEYSVIEDDLANLKRLQQENTQLRVALSTAGVALPAGVAATSAAQATAGAAVAPAQAATPAPAAAAAATATPEPETATIDAAAAALEAAVAAPAAAMQAAAPAAAPQPAAQAAPAAAAPAAAPDAFEGLVNQVEQSLQPAAEAAKAEPAAAAPAPDQTSTEGVPDATVEKSDADLVAEFEKMLNS